MHQAGFTNAWQPWNCFTTGHGTLLRRYTENVILPFTLMKAGQRAILRAIRSLRTQDLPSMYDLTLIRPMNLSRTWKEALEERLGRRSAFYVPDQGAIRELQPDDPEDKQVSAQAAKLLAGIDEPLERRIT
jgi:DNA primase